MDRPGQLVELPPPRRYRRALGVGVLEEKRQLELGEIGWEPAQTQKRNVPTPHRMSSCAPRPQLTIRSEPNDSVSGSSRKAEDTLILGVEMVSTAVSN